MSKLNANQTQPEIEVTPIAETIPYKEVMNETATKLACPNETCEMYGQIGAGNIVFRNKYGKEASQNLFKCKSCKKTFSERKGTPFFGFHLPEETIFRIIRCLIEGNGTRATARICAVHRDTVTTIIRCFGDHSHRMADLFLRNYSLKECHLDELWSFLKKAETSHRA